MSTNERVRGIYLVSRKCHLTLSAQYIPPYTVKSTNNCMWTYIAIALNNFTRTRKNVLEMLRIGNTCALVKFRGSTIILFISDRKKKINIDAMEKKKR